MGLSGPPVCLLCCSALVPASLGVWLGFVELGRGLSVLRCFSWREWGLGVLLTNGADSGLFQNR